LFDIPAPHDLVSISSFSGGEVFRSGCVFRRGHGKIFYFSPDDQEYPVYHQPEIQRVFPKRGRVPGAHPSGPSGDLGARVQRQGRYLSDTTGKR
jgi:trehalose utilization protein